MASKTFFENDSLDQPRYFVYSIFFDITTLKVRGFFQKLRFLRCDVSSKALLNIYPSTLEIVRSHWLYT